MSQLLKGTQSRSSNLQLHAQVIANLRELHRFDVTPTLEQEQWHVATFGRKIISSMYYVRATSG